MFLRVEPANGLAIYDQIVRQIKFAIAQGTLQPGNRVPSVRELARELAVNPNTIARAYQQLQADRVLQPVRGLGLEVAQDAVEPCSHQRTQLVRERLSQALEEALRSGLTPDEIRQTLDSLIHELAPSVEAR